MKMADYNRRRSEIILHLLAISGLFMTVNGRLLKTLEDTVVLVNDSIRLICRSDISAEIHFYHNGNQMNARGSFYRSYKGRFEMEKTDNHTYTLVNGKAGPEDAGEYTCHDEEARGELSSANLTVLNTRLLCESNMHDNVYIGPNTCNLQQENMTFSCSVSFNGTSPSLVWRASNDSQPINSSVCDHQPNRVNCQLTLTSDPSYDGTFFTCLTAKRSGTQYNCSTKVIKVQYFSLDGELKPVEKMVDEAVECSVRSNLNLRFEWSSSEDNQETVVSNTRQHAIQKHGLYWCNVSYNVRDVQCSSMAAVIYARKSVEHNHASMTALSFFVVVLIVAIFVCLFCIWKLKNQKRKTEEEQKRKTEEDQKSKADEEQKKRNEIESAWNEKKTQWSTEKEDWKKEKDALEEILGRTGKEKFQPSVIEKPSYKENWKFITKIELKISRKAIYGIAILDDELFSISAKQPKFEVYSIKESFLHTRSGQVKGLTIPRDIISCTDKNCLFIKEEIEGDKEDNEGDKGKGYKKFFANIFRVSRNGDVEKTWKINENTGQISIAGLWNVVVPLWDGSKLLEFTFDGELVREIQISPEANRPITCLRQAILIESSYFVLIHGDGKPEQNRVCALDLQGNFMESFGHKPGNSQFELGLPSQLVIDKCHLVTNKDNSIIVADRKYRRLLLLSSQLEFITEMHLDALKEDESMSPWRVCLDEKRKFLIVAYNLTAFGTRQEARILVYAATDACLLNQTP